MISFTLLQDKQPSAIIDEAVRPSELQYTCQKCGRSFKYAGVLAIHYKKKHAIVNKVKKTHTCNICDKVFKKKCHLSDHMTVHEKTEVPCGLCDKVVYSHKLLAKHFEFHHTQVECKECGEKVDSKVDLRLHFLDLDSLFWEKYNNHIKALELGEYDLDLPMASNRPKSLSYRDARPV